MNILCALKQDLKKTIMNAGFLMCTLLALTLFLTTTCYVDGDTGRSYSVIDIMAYIGRNKIRNDQSFASYNIVQGAISGYFMMFIPILAAFPFVPNFCAERNSGLIRFSIQRTGKMRYYISKYLTSLIGGGLAVTFAYLIFAIIVYSFFPSIHSYQIQQDMQEMYQKNQMIVSFLKNVVGVFLYGAISAIPAFLMASFVKNRYLITCIPFMLVYLYSTCLTKLSYDGMAKNKQVLITIAYSLKPETVSRLSQMEETVRNALIINGLFTLIAFILFVFIMNRRWDLGE